MTNAQIVAIEDEIRAFNGRLNEWRAQIAHASFTTEQNDYLGTLGVNAQVTISRAEGLATAISRHRDKLSVAW